MGKSDSVDAVEHSRLSHDKSRGGIGRRRFTVNDDMFAGDLGYNGSHTRLCDQVGLRCWHRLDRWPCHYLVEPCASTAA